jgi:hypothetical protein
MRHPILRPALLAITLLAGADAASAAQCGSALLLEVDAPAALDGVDLLAPGVARFWEAGAAGTNRSDDGCQTGCTAATGPLCLGGSDCIALTGVNWLNAPCTVQGHLPLRTVFVLEQTTTDSGGRWAAVNLSRNADDANTDLDAKAATACGGCASVASPYLGGDGLPHVTGSSTGGGMLTVELSWSAPSAAAQMLSDGPNLVTGYGVHYRTDTGPQPASTGDRGGWTLALDVATDGQAHGGFSTDTTATVEIPLAGLEETISFAVALSFDGSGDPTSDVDTVASAYLSAASDPLAVPTGCGEPNELLVENLTVEDVQEIVACLKVIGGNGLVVAPAGSLTLRAGQSIELRDGFSVQSGGTLVLAIDPSLAP